MTVERYELQPGANQYQRFELWYANRFGEPCEMRDGRYIDTQVQLYWECWRKAVDQCE